MNIITDEKIIDEILERGKKESLPIIDDENIFPSKDEFRKKLLSGNRLRFYIGFDATAPTLHLGHARNFLLMEKFRQLGHEIIILFGDFTARIGDPDKESARKQLSKKEVDFNVSQWKKLVKPLMDFDNKENPVQIKYNSEWLSKLNFEEIINLASNFTVQQMLERDMFEKRMGEGKPIYLHEFFYPLMQGYDSVAMDVDVEVCGTDQIFNALAGRTLLKKLKNKEKFVVATSLIQNPITKEMMSKSKGTGVFLDASPEDMFGQIMAQPDEMIKVLFVNLTELSSDEMSNINIEKNPLEAKKRLSWEITNLLYGEKKANTAQKDWETKFSKKEMPNDLKLIKEKYIEDEPLSKTIFRIFPKEIKSNSSAKILIEQAAVDINDETISDPYSKLEKNKEYSLKIGKKMFKKIILN